MEQQEENEAWAGSLFIFQFLCPCGNFCGDRRLRI